MTTNTETAVPEQPATHKKNAQLWVLVVGGVFLAMLIVTSIVRLAREPTKIGKQREDKAVVSVVDTPADGEAEFQRRLAAEEERRAREAAAGKNTTETTEQVLDRLRRQREEQAQLAALSPAERSDAKQLANASGRGTVQKSAEEQWAEKERLRVLNSRAAAIKVQLADNRSSAATPARPSSTRTASLPAQNRLSAPGTSLTQEQQAVRSELQRVQQIKRQLEAGEMQPEDAATEMAGGFQRTALSRGDQSETTGATPSGSERIVGQPASVSTPAPGQKLIDITTVARAFLDQQVMSDYEGPFRGMIMDDVYDATNRYIMIPKGSRVDGTILRIRNINEPIQARMGMLIRWIVLPRGAGKISFNKQVLLDAEGVSAIKDRVNRHLMAQFLGVAAYALVSSETSREGSGLLNDRTFESDVGEGLRDQFAPLAQKYLALVPTITLRPSTPLRIYFEEEVYAYPWADVSADIVSQARSSRAP